MLSQEEKLDKDILGEEIRLNGRCMPGNDVISFPDAAAICQYVYATNPMYAEGRVKYHTKTENWIPYVQEDKALSVWTKIRNGISGLLGNGAFLGFSTPSDNFSAILIDNMKEKELDKDKQYSSMEMFGLLGGRIESSYWNSSELLSVLRGRLNRPRTGFRSMIFYTLKNDKIDKIAYVTEGSKSGTDVFGGGVRGFVDWIGDWILADVAQGVSGLSPQHTFSIQNAKILDKICSSKGIKLCFVGHSLGGGLAVSNAIATKRPAVAFDMAGVHGLRRLLYSKNLKILQQDEMLQNFYVKGEILSTRWYEMIAPNHLEKSTELEYIGANKYSSPILHNHIFFCKYFKLEKLKGGFDSIANGLKLNR